MQRKKGRCPDSNRNDGFRPPLGRKRCQVPFLGRPGLRSVFCKPNCATALHTHFPFPFQDAEKILVMRGPLEKARTKIRAVERVVDHATDIDSLDSSHARILPLFAKKGNGT